MAMRFSGCEIVELGIRIEKNGKDFYAALAAQSDNTKIEEAFNELASAEEEHISVFQGIFDSACKCEPAEAYPEEYFAYMNSLASTHVFTQKNKGAEIAKGVKDYNEGIELGIRFEKDTILFFEGMKRLVGEKDRALIDRLIDEEKSHLKKLLELEVKDEECKSL